MKKLFNVMFVGLIFVSGAALAEEAAAPAAELGANLKIWLAIAAGFGMAIASTTGAWSQSKALSTALEGIARNPGAQDKIFIPMVVGLALIESLVLLTFVIAIVLSLKV